ncbi:MAG: AAA family ATPase, partial [Nitrospirae bacterium]|nr:AAA family ATPase [Nitrospirota bacterium]
MRIITNITIRDFRSIASAQINIPSGYLPIVGANNSGKSNILRALNLYFNNETEPGRLLNIKEDFHNPSRKKKREICIAIEFNLPEHFNFQKTIRSNLDGLLGRHFVIEKRWSIPESPIEKEAKLSIHFRKGNDDLRLAETDEEYHIRQFLSLVRFRYLPNHIHPSEILLKEQNSIQTELLAKLRRSKRVSAESQSVIFEELGNLSKEFILPVAKVLQGAAPDIEAIDLSMPKDMGELLFSFAPRLKVCGGETFNALLHGSGVQSLLTLLILKYLDSQFYSRFGWHQATIWAIEEPESFLHQDLEHKVASLLSETGKPDDSRFQIFCTTHSNVFIRYSIKGLICSLKNGRTDTELSDARTLAGEASKLG